MIQIKGKEKFFPHPFSVIERAEHGYPSYHSYRFVVILKQRIQVACKQCEAQNISWFLILYWIPEDF